MNFCRLERRLFCDCGGCGGGGGGGRGGGAAVSVDDDDDLLMNLVRKSSELLELVAGAGSDSSRTGVVHSMSCRYLLGVVVGVLALVVETRRFWRGSRCVRMLAAVLRLALDDMVGMGWPRSAFACCCCCCC